MVKVVAEVVEETPGLQMGSLRLVNGAIRPPMPLFLGEMEEVLGAIMAEAVEPVVDVAGDLTRMEFISSCLGRAPKKKRSGTKARPMRVAWSLWKKMMKLRIIKKTESAGFRPA